MAARLPYECLELIVDNIPKDDIATLHSALLVSKAWCNVVVSILWKHPFALAADLPSHHKIISVLYESLSDEARESTKIDIPSRKKNHTFSYPCFIKELDFENLYDLALTWRCVVEESRLRAWYKLYQLDEADVKDKKYSKLLQALEYGWAYEQDGDDDDDNASLLAAGNSNMEKWFSDEEFLRDYISGELGLGDVTEDEYDFENGS
ncbi:4370_t:CDS:1, partial [Paraglomus occultum]